MTKQITIIGFFVFIVTTFTFGYIILVSGKITAGSYTLYAHFTNANGIRKDSSIRISGVNIGRIKKITLDNNRAKIMLEIGKDIVVYADDILKRTNEGVLGASFLEIVPRGTGEILTDGDTISNIDDKGFIESLSSGTKAALGNVEAISARIDSYIASSGILKRITVISKQLEKVLTRINTITEGFAGNAEAISRAVRETTEAIAAISQELRTFLVNDKNNAVNQELADTLAAIKKSLQNIEGITSNLKEGKGTLGKFLTDDAVYDNVASLTARASGLSTIFDYKFEGLFSESAEFVAKNHVNLLIQPPDSSRHYHIGITHGGSPSFENTHTYTSSLGDSGIKLNAMLAQNFGKQKWLTIRGGIIENTGGVGVDIRPFPQWEISAEAFDFGNAGNAVTYLRTYTYVYPFLDPSDKYNPLRWLYFGGGVEDALARYKRAYFFGVGLRFKDEFAYDAVRLIPVAGAVTSVGK